MRFDFHNNIEVAWRPAVQTGVAATGDAHARTGLRTGGDAHIERLHFRHAAISVAILTNGMQLAGTAAALAGDLKLHFAADLSHAA